jgi:hypothetical protein
MLRAMWEALQTHAADNPGEPFDHEYHMPKCMKAARDANETWASSSSGADGHQVPTQRTLPLT